jgi:two-component system, OmpR family, KDP operon response regulator KdpE
VNKTNARVLVIDDESGIRHALSAGLGNLGMSVETAASGTLGIEAVKTWHPDAIILDLSLPDLSGIDVCYQIRQWSMVPIIFLSVTDDPTIKVTALESGANDYVTKPFYLEEIAARIRACLRYLHQGTGIIQIDDLCLDILQRRVTRGEVEIRLTPLEYEIIKYLMAHAGQVITHRILLSAVWGPEYEDNAENLRVFINQLRRKIEPNPSMPTYILTVVGVGYRLKSPELSYEENESQVDTVHLS